MARANPSRPEKHWRTCQGGWAVPAPPVLVSRGQGGAWGHCALQQREKSGSHGTSGGENLREQTLPLEKAAVPFTQMHSWRCVNGSLSLDTVLKMSLKIHLFPEMMAGNTISGEP